MFASAVAGFGAIPFILFGTEFLAQYGIALFVLGPIVIGAIANGILEWRDRYSLRASMSVAALAVFLASAGLMIVRAVGAICIGMALPITILLAVAGAGIARALLPRDSKWRRGKTLVSFAVLVPLAMIVEARSQAVPQMSVVTSEVIVDAPPAAVWPHLIDLKLDAQTDDPLFRAGVAYPIGTHTVGTGIGATRFCTLSTGPLVEPVTVWDAPHRLRFSVVSTPPPMKEWNPFGQTEPPHLHGFLTSHAGEFRLTPLPGGKTLLEGRSWYTNAMYPASYWRLWSDFLMHRIHRRVLDAVKRQSEAPNRQSSIVNSKSKE